MVAEQCVERYRIIDVDRVHQGLPIACSIRGIGRNDFVIALTVLCQAANRCLPQSADVHPPDALELPGCEVELHLGAMLLEYWL